MKSVKYTLVGIGLFVGMVSFVGCKEVNLGSNQGNLHVVDSLITQNSVKLEWNASSIANGYRLLVAPDIGEIIIEGGATNSYLLTGLKPRTAYSAILKRIHAEGAKDEQWGYTEFTTLSEFIEVKEEDITDRTVLVRRVSEDVINVLRVYDVNGAMVKEQPISGSTATIGELTPSTTYLIKAFNRTKAQSQLTVTTLNDCGTGALFVKDGKELADSIKNMEGKDGAIICLYKHIVYKIPSETSSTSGMVNVPASITIRSVDVNRNSNRPIINGGFNSIAGILTLQHVTLDGENSNDMAFSLSGKAGGLNIEDVRIKNYKSNILKSNATPEEGQLIVKFSNCVLSGIGNAGDTTFFVNGGALTNGGFSLYLQNSAIYNCEGKYCINLDNVSTGNDSILVENCTFNNCYINKYDQNKYMFDVDGLNHLKWKKNIMSNIDCSWSSSSSIFRDKSESSDNNYHNANNLYDVEETYLVGNNPFTQNPSFRNSFDGDLTIGNTTLIQNGIGAYGLNFK